jgi:hypothetical protein
MTCWCKGECPITRNVDTLLRAGRTADAEKMLKLALIDAPNCKKGNLALANIMTDGNRAQFAGPHLERARYDDSLSFPLLLAIGANFRARSDIKSAVMAYRSCVNAFPDRPEAWAGLICCLDLEGETEQAEHAATHALAKFPNHPDIRRQAAVVQASKKEFGRALEILGPPERMRPMDLLDAGRYQERLGCFELAWAHWMEARVRLTKRGGYTFKKQQFTNTMAGLLEMAAPKKLNSLFERAAAGGKPKIAPMFITGFPRSGTTMTESALSHHPRVAPADELPMLHEVRHLLPAALGVNVPYPAILEATTWGDNVKSMEVLQGWYLYRACFRAGPWKRPIEFFTDKMPMQEIHLPLIRLLFPHSPVFHVRRHPLDIMVSNMGYAITSGWNYSVSLEVCAMVHLAADNLLQRYKEIEALNGMVHTVRYESFVADPRTTIDAALAFAGLAPDDRCYDFHKNPRHARTISHHQVREPLYDRSVGRWRMFRDQLVPAIEILKPIIEREGYEL